MMSKNKNSVISVVLLFIVSCCYGSEGSEISQDAVNLAKKNLTLITESHKVMIRAQLYGELKKQKKAVKKYEEDVESEMIEQSAEFYQSEFTTEELKEVLKILNSDLLSQLTFSSMNESLEIVEKIKSEE